MSGNASEQSGKCLCGAVSFVAEGVDPELHACHCSMCRNWAGSPLLAAAVNKISFEGESHIKRFASSDWAERGFCDTCGTSLFYYLKEADHYIVCTGSFADQSQFKLHGEIFIDEKPASYSFAGDHPRLTGAEFMARFEQS